jgi:hypothetical protein
MKMFSEENGRAWVGGASFALASLGGMAFFFSLPGYRPRDFLARRLESSISRISDAEVLAQARRLASLGDEGTSGLVRLLGSDRDSVVEAAHAALSEELGRWRLLPVNESAPRAIDLARSGPSIRGRACQRALDLARHRCGAIRSAFELWGSDSGFAAATSDFRGARTFPFRRVVGGFLGHVRSRAI